MEALIVAFCALAVIIIVEMSYWIAITLARWTPVLLAGAFVALLAARYNVDRLDSLALGVLACGVARHWLKASSLAQGARRAR